MPPGRGSAVGRKFLARSVCVSLSAFFHSNQCLRKFLLYVAATDDVDDDVNDDGDDGDARTAIYSQQMSDNAQSGGGLSCNVLATRVLPSLVPLAVSPALNIGQVFVIATFTRSSPERAPGL